MEQSGAVEAERLCEEKAFAYYSTSLIWIGNEIQITIKYSTGNVSRSALGRFLFVSSVLLRWGRDLIWGKEAQLAGPKRFFLGSFLGQS